jgi:hypothetical protein
MKNSDEKLEEMKIPLPRKYATDGRPFLIPNVQKD